MQLHPGHRHALRRAVAAADRRLAPGDSMAAALRRFHAEHERAFSFRDESRPVEV